MATSLEAARRRIDRWQASEWTSVVLEEDPSGRWRATQRGVPVEGRGETALQAFTTYSRRVSGHE